MILTMIARSMNTTADDRANLIHCRFDYVRALESNLGNA